MPAGEELAVAGRARRDARAAPRRCRRSRRSPRRSRRTTAPTAPRSSWRGRAGPTSSSSRGTLATIADAVRDAGVRAHGRRHGRPRARRERASRQPPLLGGARAAVPGRDAPRVLCSAARARRAMLAAALARDGVPVISSLAGRVERPRLPEGEVRVGGFGGPDGLARVARRERHRGGRRRHAPVRGAHLGVGGDRLRARRACPCCGSSAPAGASTRATTGTGSATRPRRPQRSPGSGDARLPDDGPAGPRGIRRRARALVPGALHRPARAAAARRPARCCSTAGPTPRGRAGADRPPRASTCS